MTPTPGVVTLVCSECYYEKEVSADDETLPARYVVEHGKETGHSVGIRYISSE